MNQPTREEFDELKQEQERLRQEQEALKRRLEQATEPMKAINVNVASADVLARLDKLEQSQLSIKQDIATMHDALAQRIVDEGNEVVERIDALLIKYLRPSGNGHT